MYPTEYYQECRWISDDCKNVIRDIETLKSRKVLNKTDFAEYHESVKSSLAGIGYALFHDAHIPVWPIYVKHVCIQITGITLLLYTIQSFSTWELDYSKMYLPFSWGFFFGILNGRLEVYNSDFKKFKPDYDNLDKTIKNVKSSSEKLKYLLESLDCDIQNKGENVLKAHQRAKRDVPYVASELEAFYNKLALGGKQENNR